MPKRYEAMYVVRPDVSEDELATTMQRAADTVTNGGGTVELNEVWDRRQLAYEIDRVTHGTYCLMYFDAEGDAVQVLRRELELDEQVLRAGVFVANPDAVWRPQAPGVPQEAPESGTEAAQPAEGEPETAAEPAEPTASEEAQPAEEEASQAEEPRE